MGERPFDVVHEESEEEALRTTIETLNKQLQAKIAELETQIAKLEFKSSVTSDPPGDPDEDGNEPGESADLDDKRAKQKDAEKKTGEADDASVQWTASRYLGAILTVVSVGVSVVLIIEYIARAVQKQPTDDLPPLDPATSDAIEKLADEWTSMSDADYWNKLADYVDPAKQTDLSVAADYLGLAEAQLQAQLENGKSLADVAKAQGKTVDGLVQALYDAKKKDLDAAVKAGTLTQAQEDATLSDLESRLTDLVSATSLSLGDQLIFMNITKKIAGRSGGFIWNSAQDEADMTDKLVAAYNSGGAAAMYRLAATTTYEGAPVPRVIMADVLSLALSWVGATQTQAVAS